jgi:hypothetical protein
MEDREMIGEFDVDRQFFSSDSGRIPWRLSQFAHGVEFKSLGRANGRAMQLVRFSPGAAFPDHYHPGPEFIYVLDGEVVQNGRRLSAGCVGVARKGSIDTGFHSVTGSVFLLVYEVGQNFNSTTTSD